MTTLILRDQKNVVVYTNELFPYSLNLLESSILCRHLVHNQHLETATIYNGP